MLLDLWTFFPGLTGALHYKDSSEDMVQIADGDPDAIPEVDLNATFDMGADLWNSVVIRNRSEKRYVANCLLFVAGEAILILNSDRNKRTGEQKQLSLHLHGGSFALSPGVSTKRPSKLFLVRSRDRSSVDILPQNPNSIGTELLQSVSVEAVHVQAPIGSCFILTEKGIERDASRDSFHGETDTRLAYIQGEIIRQQDAIKLRRQARTFGDIDVCSYVLSCESDIPCVLLLDERRRDAHIYVEVGSSVYDLRRARRAADSIGIPIETLSLLFAFGGCDWTAFCKKATQVHFLESYVNLRKQFNPPLSITLLATNTHFDTLCLLAHLWKAVSRCGGRAPWPLFPSQSAPGLKEWNMDARVFLEKSRMVSAADDMPPEPKSTHLNALRAKWAVQMRRNGQDRSGRAWAWANMRRTVLMEEPVHS